MAGFARLPAGYLLLWGDYGVRVPRWPLFGFIRLL